MTFFSMTKLRTTKTIALTAQHNATGHILHGGLLHLRWKTTYLIPKGSNVESSRYHAVEKHQYIYGIYALKGLALTDINFVTNPLDERPFSRLPNSLSQPARGVISLHRPPPHMCPRPRVRDQFWPGCSPSVVVSRHQRLCAQATGSSGKANNAR